MKKGGVSRILGVLLGLLLSTTAEAGFYGPFTTCSTCTFTVQSGTGLSVIAGTMTALATNDILRWNGTDWVNTNSPTFVAPVLGTPASGVATNLTGTAAGLTAGTVTTNANLTGPITSVGNATAMAAQTGTGTVFVVQTAPTITGGAHNAVTSFGVRSTGTGAFDLKLANTENLTVSDKTLTVTLSNANRTLTLAADATLSGTNTGDQTITLTGDVTGSGTGSFAATVAADAVALTTDTTGNYVASVATTSPITGGAVGSEGGVLTVACATCGVTGSPLSQFAATTSAQLAGVLSDETGSGLSVFDTTPIFVTNITAPVVIGGAAVGATLALRSTSGVGTTDAIIMQVGNNGATEALRILNNGNVGIGDATPASLFTVGDGDDFQVSSVGAVTTNTTIKSTAASDLGWTVQNAANQACNTTCTVGACVVGIDTAVFGNFLDCLSALSDSCICAG